MNVFCLFCGFIVDVRVTFDDKIEFFDDTELVLKEYLRLSLQLRFKTHWR